MPHAHAEVGWLAGVGSDRDYSVAVTLVADAGAYLGVVLCCPDLPRARAGESDEGAFWGLRWLAVGVFTHNCRMPGFFHPSPVMSALPHKAHNAKNHTDQPYGE